MSRKIAIVLNTSWNVFNFRLSLLKKIQNRGYEVTVIAPYDKYTEKLQEEGFKTVNLKMNNDGTNLFQEIKLLFQFFSIYKKNTPDTVLHYTIKPNLYGTVAAKLLNIPSINNISGLGTIFIKDKISYRLIRLLYKLILRFPKKVFFQNKNDHQIFLENNFVSHKNSETIPGSGINVDRFKPSTSKEKNENFTFLMIARLIQDKGVVEYVKAAKMIKQKFPTTKFQLIGDLYLGNPTAIQKEELQEWIQDGIIEYIGTSDNINDIIATVDCVTLPSYREGLSRVLLEASAMEKPIITTNVPGCIDVVDDHITGLICKVKDYEDLAKKMEEMLTLPETQRELMGKAGRKKIINEFNEDIVINKYLETIEKFCKIESSGK